LLSAHYIAKALLAIDAVATEPPLWPNKMQQHLNYFPALKRNKAQTNTTESVFSEVGLKYFDIGLDG